MARLKTISCFLFSGDKFQGNVGFLGIGIMGSPMAHNLIKSGYVFVMVTVNWLS